MEIVDLGSYLEIDGRPAVRFERRFPQPIDRVWSAVTEPDELRRWFPSRVDYEQRVGAPITFSGDPNLPGTVHGTVLAWDPPREFRMTWGDDEVHFTLSPDEGGGCRLVMVNVLNARDEAARNAAGGYICLAELAGVLAGQETGGPHAPTAEPFQPIYQAHVAAGLPSGAPVPGT